MIIDDDPEQPEIKMEYDIDAVIDSPEEEEDQDQDANPEPLA